MACPSAAGSLSGASSPVSSWRTISGMPVTGVETHGVPSARASRSTVGRPSRLPSAPTTHGAAKTSAAATISRTRDCGSAPCIVTTSPSPSSPMRSRSVASRGPVPTRSTCTSLPAPTSSATAVSRSPKPFFSTSRPTAAMRSGPAVSPFVAKGKACRSTLLYSRVTRSAAAPNSRCRWRRLYSLTVTVVCASRSLVASSAGTTSSWKMSLACAVKDHVMPVRRAAIRATSAAIEPKCACRCSSPERRTAPASSTAARATSSGAASSSSRWSATCGTSAAAARRPDQKRLALCSRER